MHKYQHYIDGQYRASVDGRTFETFDPFRGTAWAEVARGEHGRGLAHRGGHDAAPGLRFQMAPSSCWAISRS